MMATAPSQIADVNRGVNGWSAVGGMCESAYIPTGYKIGEKPHGETVRLCKKASFITLTHCL